MGPKQRTEDSEHFDVSIFLTKSFTGVSITEEMTRMKRPKDGSKSKTELVRHKRKVV